MKKYKYTPYSYSSISTYLQCPRKFRYLYIDKIPVEWTDNFYTQKGKLTHLIFEHQRDLVKIKGEKEFKEIIGGEFLTKDDVKNCFAIYDNFMKSPIGKQLESKKRLFSEIPIGLDHELNFTGYSQNPFLRGYIDASFVNEEDDSSMVLTDWKTGKLVSKENQDWSQLLYYGISMFSMNPNLEKIVLMFAYVEHNKTNMKVIHRSEINKYKTALWNSTDKIEEDIVFPKCQTALCDYCYYRDHCDQDTTTDGLTNEDIPF